MPKLAIAAVDENNPGFKLALVSWINKGIKVLKVPNTKPTTNNTKAGIRTLGFQSISQYFWLFLSLDSESDFVKSAKLGSAILQVKNTAVAAKAADIANKGV